MKVEDVPEEWVHQLAASLDHPSVFMGGPSERNKKRAREALAAVIPAIQDAERERVKKLVVNECEDLMQRTETPKRRAQEDGHFSEECHQEGRWHGVNDLLEWAEKIGPAAIRALKEGT